MDTAEILWQLCKRRAIHINVASMAISVQISRHFAENWAAELVRTVAYLQFLPAAARCEMYTRPSLPPSLSEADLVAFFVSPHVRGEGNFFAVEQFCALLYSRSSEREPANAARLLVSCPNVSCYTKEIENQNRMHFLNYSLGTSNQLPELEHTHT